MIRPLHTARRALRRVFVPLLILAASNCERGTAVPTALAPTQPGRDILDAVHGGGNPHFYFLPPMVPAVQYSGTFDATLKPSVDICVVQNGACSTPVVATFVSGTGSANVRVDAGSQNYIVNWNTGAYTLDLNATYRIRVRVVNTELGHCDVRLVQNGAAAKNTTTGDDIVLVDGRTLPIKFRIEQGATAVIGASGGTAVLNDGAVLLQFSPAALPSDAGVTATPVVAGSPQASDPSVIPGTQYEFQPSPTTFAAPVTLTLSYPATLPPRVDGRRLAICKMSAGACRPIVGSTVNTANHTVSGPITSFSSYAIDEFPEVLYWLESEVEAPAWWLHTAQGEVRIIPHDTFREEWSPNGSRIAYTTRIGGIDRSSEVRVVNADGTGDQHLAGTALNDNWLGQAECPRWSPDGTRIVFGLVTSPTVTSIVITNADGSGQTTLNAPGMPLAQYSIGECTYEWMDNGSLAMFGSSRENVFSLFRVGTNGSIVGNLGPAFASEIRRSPDGLQLAFIGEWAGSFTGGGIYVMNADGTNVRLAVDFAGISPNGRPPRRFEWSPVPGDSRILFHSPVDSYGQCLNPYDDVYHMNCLAYSPGIWIVNADGSNAHQVIGMGNHEHAPQNPTWSRDARRVIFEWQEGDYHNLYLVNTDGSGLQPILEPGRHGVDPRGRP